MQKTEASKQEPVQLELFAPWGVIVIVGEMKAAICQLLAGATKEWTA
jgi:hypothetical protein